MLKLCELYSSVQGEGPLVGVPTQFVRFGGCNMKCPGWPCDSEYAVDPKFYQEWAKVTADQLIVMIVDEAAKTGAHNICFTGGEPFIQPAADLSSVVVDLYGRGFGIEFFSNGSLPVPSWLPQRSRIMLDWKLKGSGEAESFLEQRWKNLELLNSYSGIKFVCKDEADLIEATEIMHLASKLPTKAAFWVGAAWDCEITPQRIVDFTLEERLPWRLNVQVHKYIWPETARGI